MRTLKYKVQKQNVIRDNTCDFSNIVRGTNNYIKLVFEWDEDWKNKAKAISLMNAEGIETNRWHTTLAKGINLEGLETEPIVLERYPDIFEQLLNMYETNVKKQLIYNSTDMVVNLKNK